MLHERIRPILCILVQEYTQNLFGVLQQVPKNVEGPCVRRVSGVSVRKRASQTVLPVSPK